MNKDEARRLLLEGDHRERLDAARTLLGHVNAGDRQLLSKAANRENDQYVRAALLRLLLSVPPRETPEGGDGAKVAETVEVPVDERSRVIRELTDRLTHEFATVIGVLRHYASREVPSYEGSETRREIERLDSVLKATRQLADAASPPDWQEIDLGRFAKGLVRDEGLVHGYELILADGPEPHRVLGSEGLLALFLRNAITNAIEASVQLHHDQRPVVVTWGTDDRDHWLAVLDEGNGPSADLPVLEA